MPYLTTRLTDVNALTISSTGLLIVVAWYWIRCASWKRSS